MKVTVLFFSVLREIAGTDRIERETSDGATLGELVADLEAHFTGLAAWDGRLLLAVNGEYADRSTPIAAGDEVALMPPVQGG
ncbi:MAG: MoaD/ThiS family protein [Verrucomicrobiales bacterium]|nr:MoaD/ThiS family protein [Verrucomicrobiales bacterium]